MNNKTDYKLPSLRPHLKYNIIEQWHSLQDKYDFLCKWYWKDKWYALKCFFRNRNKWVIDSIPRTWIDKDTVYTKILFAGIINYVEEEKCFETIMWVTPQEKKHKKKIEEIYKWAKTGRKELQDKIENAYPPLESPITLPMRYASQEDNKKTYEELYGEVNRLEALLYKTDTDYMVWIVKFRNVLWS